MKKYIFAIILLFAVSYTPYVAMAQIKLEVGLPNIPGGQIPEEDALPVYIRYLFIFGLGSISFLALAQMIIGGILYILAEGNAAKVEDAKDKIFQALLGVGILLVSYLLLRTINPDLVNLRNPNLVPTQLQNPPANPNPTTPSTPILTPPTPIPIGGACSPGDQYPGLVCIEGRWARIVGNTSLKYPPIASIK